MAVVAAAAGAAVRHSSSEESKVTGAGDAGGDQCRDSLPCARQEKAACDTEVRVDRPGSWMVARRHVYAKTTARGPRSSPPTSRRLGWTAGKTDQDPAKGAESRVEQCESTPWGGVRLASAPAANLYTTRKLELDRI